MSDERSPDAAGESRSPIAPRDSTSTQPPDPAPLGALPELWTWTAPDSERGGGRADASGGGLELPDELRARLDAFGRASTPYECCGIGIGPPGHVAEFHAVANIHEHPVTRYEISGPDQFRLFRRADERDWQITLVFHTHPATAPYPSVTDIDLAGWPDAVYAILGCGTTPPLLRAYAIRDAAVTELPVTAPT